MYMYIFMYTYMNISVRVICDSMYKEKWRYIYPAICPYMN